MARATRFGKVSSWNTNPLLDETYEAKVVTDASISYQLIPQVRATIGANNLFDVYPDKLKWFQEANGDKNKYLLCQYSDGRFCVQSQRYPVRHEWRVLLHKSIG